MREVKPITNVNGTPIVTFEEQRELGQDIIRDKFDLGQRKTNPDGSIARSLYHNAAVNEGWFFDNRYRVKDGKIEVVTAQTSEGYRAIEGLKTGKAPYKHITAYVVKRDGKNLAFDTMVLISDDEFVTDFTNKLDKEAMKEILPLIPSGGPSVPEGKLPI